MLSGSLGRKNEEFRGCAYRAKIGGFVVRLRVRGAALRVAALG